MGFWVIERCLKCCESVIRSDRSGKQGVLSGQPFDLVAMLNVSERPSSSNLTPQPESPRADRGTATPLALGTWLSQVLHPVLGRPPQIRQRGNVIYLLCESATCPSQKALTDLLGQAIAQGTVPRHLTPEAASVHRMVLYGRAIGDAKPTWGETFELPPIADPVAAEVSPEVLPESAPERSSEVVPERPQAPAPPVKRKNLSNDGIAHHLSRQLSAYNIAVRVRRKQSKANNDLRSTLSRLYVVCESTYAPDPNVIAIPLAQCLRELALRDCQDAVISGQAKGESEPEWMLRVDLTPADRMLHQRAKWGDLDALSRLLNPMLRSVSSSVQVSLEQTTLHIAIRHPDTCPPQAALVNTIESFLTELAPQGILGASLYGIITPSVTPEKTEWVHWLDLPATQQVELSASPQDLAARGNLEAIGQLLLQQLNPNLDQQLATGGIRVQVRQREDVMHIMTDALICPNPKTTSAAILKYLPSLNIDSISGLCLYGRQAGNQNASWRHGVKLGKVHTRFVPASTPEFTASDSYVEDLMSPPGAMVFIPRREPKDWGKAWSKAQDLARSILLKTPFFVSLSSNQRLIPIRDERVSGQVAVIWGLLGLCMMISGDWALGFVLKSQGLGGANGGPIAAEISGQTGDKTGKKAIGSPMELPKLTLNKSGIASDTEAFNGSGFTKDGKTRILATSPISSLPALDPGMDAKLPVSPLMPKAQVEPEASPYPSLNSPQLDERLALYQQYVSQFGVPDVLVVGSSRALRGIDPSALQENLTQQGYASVRVFNFGINGATAQVVDLLLRRLLPPDQLPKTIVWADGARAFNSGRTDVTFNAIAASDGYKRLPKAPVSKPPKSKTATPQPEADPTPQGIHNTVTEGYQTFDRQIQDFLKSTSSVGNHRDALFGLARDRFLGISTVSSSPDPNAATSAGNLSPTGHGVIDIYGFLPLINQFNPATYYQKYSKVSGSFDSDYDSFQLQGKQQDALTSIAQFTQARGIGLVFVNLPLTSEYLDSRRREYEDEFQQSMIQSAATLKFTYRDLTTVIAQQNALFSDPSHLNRYGAYDVSVRLSRDPLIGWMGDRKSKKP